MTVLADQIVADPRARLGGRGAWICPERACAEAVTARFGRIRHLLRFQGSKRAPDFKAMLGEAVRTEALAALPLAHRGGRIASGPRRLLQRPGQIAAVIIATDLPPSLEAELRQGLSTELLVDLGLNAFELGARLGRGSRSALGLLGTPGDAGLLRWLRWRARLG